MTSKIVVNNIEADTGVSTVTFSGDISANKIITSSTSEFTSGLNVTGGSVGIGTDNPDSKLNVESTSTLVSNFVRTNSGAGAFRFQVQDGESSILQLGDISDGDIQRITSDNSDNSLYFHTNNNERLRITSSGNVGIGTEIPGARLEVNSGTSSQLIVKTPGDNSTARATRLSFAFDDGESAAIQSTRTSGGSTLNCNLSFRTGGVTNSEERLGIGTDGNVSITNGNLVFSTSGTGIDFSATADGSGTTDSELLDDYEEGTFTMTVSCDGNTDDQQCRYTKIGRVVYIDGHGNSELSNYFNTGGQAADTAVTITSNLPFTPAKTGAAPITVSRTLKGANGFEYERMYVGWISDSATIYLGSESNQYYPANNVVTQNTQTNKTLLFSGFFVIE